MSINFEKFNSVVSLFLSQSQSHSDKPYLWKKSNDQFISLSWKEVRQQVEAIAKGLINLGILSGDRVIILSENRPEWQIADSHPSGLTHRCMGSRFPFYNDE